MTDLNFVKLKKKRFFWHLKVGSNLKRITAFVAVRSVSKIVFTRLGCLY